MLTIIKTNKTNIKISRIKKNIEISDINVLLEVSML